MMMKVFKIVLFHLKIFGIYIYLFIYLVWLHWILVGACELLVAMCGI